MSNDDRNAGKERRRHNRFECEGDAEVVVFQPKFLFRGRVRDISLSGCYIETSARLNLKRSMKVELRFRAHGLCLASLARVMQVQPGKGVGFEFLANDLRMERPFQRLIKELKPSLPGQ